MARKRGLFGILLVVLLYFLSGVFMVYITNFIDSHISDSVPLRDYIIAGLASVAGFLYRFIVVRLGRKSLKKLLTGRRPMSRDIDEEMLKRMAERLYWKIIKEDKAFKSKKAKELFRELTQISRDVLWGKITPLQALKGIDKLAEKALRARIPQEDKKLLLLRIAHERLQIGADFFYARQEYMHEQRLKKRQKKRKYQRKGPGKKKGKKKRKK